MNKVMYGTTNSIFTVVTGNAAGRVGYREIGDDQYRVRVEPTQGKLSLEGWTSPDYSHNRYSKVVDGVEELVKALSTAQSALALAAISIQ